MNIAQIRTNYRLLQQQRQAFMLLKPMETQQIEATLETRICTHLLHYYPDALNTALQQKLQGKPEEKVLQYQTKINNLIKNRQIDELRQLHKDLQIDYGLILISVDEEATDISSDGNDELAAQLVNAETTLKKYEELANQLKEHNSGQEIDYSNIAKYEQEIKNLIVELIDTENSFRQGCGKLNMDRFLEIVEKNETDICKKIKIPGNEQVALKDRVKALLQLYDTIHRNEFGKKLLESQLQLPGSETVYQMTTDVLREFINSAVFRETWLDLLAEATLNYKILVNLLTVMLNIEHSQRPGQETEQFLIELNTQGLLVLPIQRAPRYKMLLSSILKAEDRLANCQGFYAYYSFLHKAKLNFKDFLKQLEVAKGAIAIIHNKLIIARPKQILTDDIQPMIEEYIIKNSNKASTDSSSSSTLPFFSAANKPRYKDEITILSNLSKGIREAIDTTKTAEENYNILILTYIHQALDGYKRQDNDINLAKLDQKFIILLRRLVTIVINNLLSDPTINKQELYKLCITRPDLVANLNLTDQLANLFPLNEYIIKIVQIFKGRSSIPDDIQSILFSLHEIGIQYCPEKVASIQENIKQLLVDKHDPLEKIAQELPQLLVEASARLPKQQGPKTYALVLPESSEDADKVSQFAKSILKAF